jgi:hypothetical protein
MAKKLFIMFFAMMIGQKNHAQTANDSIQATINHLFLAMKTGDTALLRSCFADSAILQTIVESKTSEPMVRNENVEAFIRAIGSAAPGSLDEQITFDVVKVDGSLGIVWTPYQFYFKGTFSHCGVNSFQLIRNTAGWKIQYIIDTRRRNGCK